MTCPTPRTSRERSDLAWSLVRNPEGRTRDAIAAEAGVSLATVAIMRTALNRWPSGTPHTGDWIRDGATVGARDFYPACRRRVSRTAGSASLRAVR